ncbi:MAG: hypothetical protein ABW220_14035 [Burkholderiaceae bacterium]
MRRNELFARAAGLICASAFLAPASQAELAPAPTQTLAERAEVGSREVVKATLDDAHTAATYTEQEARKAYRAAAPQAESAYNGTKRVVEKGVQWADQKGRAAELEAKKLGSEISK